MQEMSEKENYLIMCPNLGGRIKAPLPVGILARVQIISSTVISDRRGSYDMLLILESSQWLKINFFSFSFPRPSGDLIDRIHKVNLVCSAVLLLTLVTELVGRL